MTFDTVPIKIREHLNTYTFFGKEYYSVEIETMTNCLIDKDGNPMRFKGELIIPYRIESKKNFNKEILWINTNNISQGRIVDENFKEITVLSKK